MNIMKYLRDQKLYHIVHQLLPNHDNHQLDGKLKEAARSVAVIRLKSLKVSISFLSTVTKVPRMLKKPPLMDITKKCTNT